MTEAEWLGTTDHPWHMLEFLEMRVSRRKWFCFVCACYRRVWESLTEQATFNPRRWVEDTEKVIENLSRLQDQDFDIALHVLADAASLRSGEHEHQCDLLRDIFGNPFRPSTIEMSWLTQTVICLAETIYQERAFDRLSILADALEDAGCTDAAILDHCRSGGDNVRGCWVVDLLLGKE